MQCSVPVSVYQTDQTDLPLSNLDFNENKVILDRQTVGQCSDGSDIRYAEIEIEIEILLRNTTSPAGSSVAGQSNITITGL